MACKNICRLCNKLILSQSVSVAAGGELLINIPAGSYENQEKYCIVIAQDIPDAVTVNAEVMITIGSGSASYPLVTRDCKPVVAANVRKRTKYSTIVQTSNTTGVFRLLGCLCNPADELPAINGN